MKQCKSAHKKIRQDFTCTYNVQNQTITDVNKHTSAHKTYENIMQNTKKSMQKNCNNNFAILRHLKITTAQGKNAQ